MGQEVAGITSRRICYCIVARRLLRRDVISGTLVSGAAYEEKIKKSAMLHISIALFLKFI